jgi:hypothetical protein
MKKIIAIAGFIFLTGLSVTVNAQVVKKTTHAVKKGAKSVAHKTVEMASQGKARVTDKVYKDKRAPNGKIVYIDDQSRYYWIDDRGHRMYVKESELHDKPMKD